MEYWFLMQIISPTHITNTLENIYPENNLQYAAKVAQVHGT